MVGFYPNELPRPWPSAKFACIAALCVATTASDARCARLGHLIHNYGKHGPTKDARDMFEKYAANWAAENGITKYSIGTKDVKYERTLLSLCPTFTTAVLKRMSAGTARRRQCRPT